MKKNKNYPSDLTPHSSPQKAFTLIEILLVLAIMGLMAGVAIPQLSFYFEPPAAGLQRAIEEAEDKALSGMPVRLSVKSEGISRRGRIVAEGLTKREAEANSLSAFLGTDKNRPVILEWQKIKMQYLPETSGWRFSPEVIYFYSDGSCTPAKISWEDPDMPIISTSSNKPDEYILTVTGYCMLTNNKE
ncbi:MAG: prepilin-type N-terminal cleavage/methylation domain-containing protein [Synergistales bacterium]|nr:prepilin-type N-terminal cleavage/methylation domain-containing protein [Synergistales bacterium]MDY6401288.1 prepilin-type N-terminal cleavage/methylation domain-containing protein [Synergistales bacterium]MDY6404372.1 prepilin-type N-terminal cleavage/methylation domain-containing protein [Synergistales bacterium]MDY6410269.1 prepilin-type N-terminal cleavage/methylation domain-containing protein [Synergistales bacterium]MDY6414363.1 prepilin-type N-terminal cleavage/methylation domain-con